VYNFMSNQLQQFGLSVSIQDSCGINGSVCLHVNGQWVNALLFTMQFITLYEV
jgi:hypothetical protein